MRNQLSRNSLVFIIVSLIGLLYTLPFIINDFIYEDDYQRLFYGYAGWSANGRPFADLIFYILSPKGGIVDIHPLGQIISIALCACIGFLFGKRYNQGVVLSSIVALSLICHPFYLESLAYRFDSLTMTLSIFLASLPFLIEIKNKLTSFVFNTVCIFLALCTYQVAFNVYLCFFAISLILKDDQSSLKDSFKYLLSNVFQSIFAVIAYSQFSSHFVDGKYSKNLSKTVADSDNGIIYTVIQNIRRISNLNESMLNGSGFYLFASFLIIIFLISLVLIFTNIRKRPSRIFDIIVSFLAVAFVYYGGILLSLDHPVVFPRTALGIGGVIAFIFVVSFKGIERLNLKNIILVISASLLFMHFTVISYTYANNLNRQNEMQELVSLSLFQTIDRNNIDELYVSGLENTRNPKLLNYYNNRITKNYPVISWLTPTIFGRWGWIIDTKLKMMGLNVFKGEFKGDNAEMTGSSECRKSSLYDYCIYGNKMHVTF